MVVLARLSARVISVTSSRRRTFRLPAEWEEEEEEEEEEEGQPDCRHMSVSKVFETTEDRILTSFWL